MMELVNAARKAIDSGPGAGDPAVREAAEVVTVALTLVAPYAAEEMWERLGHAPTVAMPAGRPSTRRCWSPSRSPASSRSRARCATGWRSRRTSTEADLEALALADEAVVRSLAGAPAKVIVRAPKLVNIVVGS